MIFQSNMAAGFIPFTKFKPFAEVNDSFGFTMRINRTQQINCFEFDEMEYFL